MCEGAKEKTEIEKAVSKQTINSSAGQDTFCIYWFLIKFESS